MPQVVFETARLLVRAWTLEDAESAFQIYGDPAVMRFLGTVEPDLSHQRATLARIIERDRRWANGMGFWAITETHTGKVVGGITLKPLEEVGPEIEVGWHLRRQVWGHGYATEAARGLLRYGFDKLKLERIVAVIRPANYRSRHVARRLGMVHIGRAQHYGHLLDIFVADRETAHFVGEDRAQSTEQVPLGDLRTGRARQVTLVDPGSPRWCNVVTMKSTIL
jgi:ribosomal-protein-alanine N-acetyltransferase